MIWKLLFQLEEVLLSSRDVDLVAGDDHGLCHQAELPCDRAQVAIRPVLGFFHVQFQLADRDIDMVLVHIEAGKLFRERGLDITFLLHDLAGEFLPPLLQYAVEPEIHLDFQELDIIRRVIGPFLYRFSTFVRGAGNIDDMDERVCLAEIVQELVSHSFAFMSARNQSRDIDQLDRDEPCPFLAEPFTGIALDVEILVDALDADISS
jgi:hypothetical protein